MRAYQKQTLSFTFLEEKLFLTGHVLPITSHLENAITACISLIGKREEGKKKKKTESRR